MKVGYIRVSTVEQNEDRQKVLMKKNGIEKLFIDKCSGKDTNRPKLKELMEFVRKGDTVYVESFSRLARSTKDLLELVKSLNDKGVNLISFKENIDTTTPHGKLMLTMLGAIAEFERDCLLERQREGIALAKAKGKYKGRKKIGYPNNWEEVYNRYKTRKITATKAMEILSLKRNTFYKLKKEWEQKQENIK
ncbi:recombinase family protein [Tepidibacter thalassicus]|uniref:Site-specific DNA recombinase n=1 Tax=Tepidibacter thalassicus DSM 15285 TaxID=1123350 RepID=A0A1M5TXA4_9FIRM|nr:recombinase family protein [Tepidibacter thalassicus]SHH55422.1 Site-specific DNA recombinase [Tepidibacter thalassicus DSM 15285]